MTFNDYKNDNLWLMQGDCLERMKEIPTGTVDMILCDPPYGTTQCKWDSVIPLDKMWLELKRITKSNGAIVMTASQPFTSILICSNLKSFKYDIVWEKTVQSGQLNIKTQPMRSHESILVFYNKVPTYNEQTTLGTPYNIKRKSTTNQTDTIYNVQKDSSKENIGFRHARSIIKVNNPRIKGGHPTQKPVALMEYLIRTYTNEQETIMDFTMGSGTTGVACKNLNRKFIGIEQDDKYFQIANDRILG